MAEDETIEEYRTSLAELKFNSKPVINMLTMLAEDNSTKAQQIVQVIENHILKVEALRKLPVLYLIDSICKNLQDTSYKELFAQSIVTIFAKVFEEVDEKTRQSMFKLRQTWATIFPNKRLYGIDVRLQLIDPAWPMTAEEPEQMSIHVNPKFLVQPNVEDAEDVEEKSIETEAQMRKKLIAKQQELLKLQQQRLEMEQAEIARLEQQQKKSEITRSKLSNPVSLPTPEPRPPSSIHINPSVHVQNPQVWNLQNTGDMSQGSEMKVSRDPRVRDPRRANRDPRIQQQTNLVMQQQPQQQQQFIQPQAISPHSTIMSETVFSHSLPSQSVTFSQPPNSIHSVPSQQSAPAGINQGQLLMQQPLIQQPLVSLQPTPLTQPTAAADVKLSSATTQSMLMHSHTTAVTAALPEPAAVQTSSQHPQSMETQLPHSTPIQPHVIQSRPPDELGQQPVITDFQHTDSSLQPLQPQQPFQPEQPSLLHPHSTQTSPNSRPANAVQPSSTSINQTKPVTSPPSSKLLPQSVSSNIQQPPLHGELAAPPVQQLNQTLSPPQLSPQQKQSKSPLQNPGEPVPPVFLQQFAHKPIAQEPSTDNQPPSISTAQKETSENQNNLGKQKQETDEKEGVKVKSFDSVGKLGRIPKISDRDKKPNQISSSGNKFMRELSERRDKRNLSRSMAKEKDSDSEKSRDRKAERSLDNSRRHFRDKDSGRVDRIDRSNRTSDRKGDERRDKDLKSQSRHDSGDHWRRGSWERERSPRNRSPDRRKWEPDNRSPRKIGEDTKERSDPKTRTRSVASKTLHGRDSRERRPADKKIAGDSRQKDKDSVNKKLEVDKVKDGKKGEADIKMKDSMDVNIRTEKENRLKRKSNSEHSDRSENLESRSETTSNEQASNTDVIDMDLDVDQDDRISDADQSTKRLKLDAEAKPKSMAPADISELIGGEDQDYRRPIPPPVLPQEEVGSPQDRDERMLSPDKPGHVGWSHFKQAHPEDFAYEIEHQRREPNYVCREPLQENKRFQNGPMDEVFDENNRKHQFHPDRIPFEHRDTKDMYSCKREFEDTDYRRHPANVMHSTPVGRPDKIKSVLDLGPADFGNAIKRFEKTPLPKAFSLQKREVVLEEAAKRLQAGEITHEQHQEILKQLSEVYNIQKTLHRRSLDKEFMKREDTGQEENLQNTSPDVKRSQSHSSPDQKDASGPEPLKRRTPEKMSEFGMKKEPEPSQNMQRPKGENQQVAPPAERLNTGDTVIQGGLNNSFESGTFLDEDRLTFISGMWGTDQSEEIVIDRVPYEIRLGGKPKKVTIGNICHELCADAEKRCILFDHTKVYTFGDPMATITVNGKKSSIFYHGRPKFLWISGEQFEVRLDAPPRRFNINNEEHSIHINGATRMIYIDRVEMGPCGGPPRQIVIENQKHELRFEPPPRHIMIDQKICELKLDTRVPVILIDGKLHGIRFDGPPVNLLIDSMNYSIPVDKPVKIKLGKRSHKILLGGPAHEIVLDGKWFELKFGGQPKKLFYGNRVHVFQLSGSSPDVKILGEVSMEMLLGRKQAFRNRMNIPQYQQLDMNRGCPDKNMMQNLNTESHQGGLQPKQMGVGLRPTGPESQPPVHGSHHGPRPPIMGPVPRHSGPEPLQMDPRHQQIGPGPQHMGQGPQLMGPGPQPMGPGPQQVGPGPQHMGLGPPQMAPRPQHMAAGPQHIVPGPQPMGPGPQHVGQGPQQMAPTPQQMGPGPQTSGPQQMGHGPQQIDQGPQQMVQGLQQMGLGMPQLRPGFQQIMGTQQFGSNIPHSGPQLGPGPQQIGQGLQPMVSGTQFVPTAQQMGPVPQQSSNSVQNPMGIIDPRLGGPQLVQNQPVDQRFGGPQQLAQQQGQMNMLQPRPTDPMNVGGGHLPGNQQMLPLQGPRLPIQNQQIPQNVNLTGQPAGSLLPAQLDINALFQKLVTAGIIDSKKPQDGQEEGKSNKENENEEEGDGEVVIEHVPDISGLELYKLKKPYNGVIQRLYTGIQCSSCGVRFLLEDTEEYREHLDWHFRQNKKNEGAAVSKFQSWHYSINEWIQYEEVGSVEERSHSVFFESQKTTQQPTYTAAILDSSNVIKNPPATGDDICEICSDPFDQYWDEDEEEWHLKDAVRVEDKTYHPVCYEDVKETTIIETPSPTTEPTKPLQVEVKKEKKEPEEEKEDMGKKIQDQIKKELGMLDNPLQTLLNLAKEKKS